MNHRRKQGFTLIELLLVVVIIGILAAIVAPKLIGRSKDAQIAAAKADIKTMSTQLAAYEVDNGTFPTTDQGLQALIFQPTSAPQPKNWKGPYIDAKSMPLDPWNNPYIYFYPGELNPNGFDLVSAGPDGTRATADDIE